jgi:hypothetical protein
MMNVLTDGNAKTAGMKNMMIKYYYIPKKRIEKFGSNLFLQRRISMKQTCEHCAKLRTDQCLRPDYCVSHPYSDYTPTLPDRRKSDRRTKDRRKSRRN